MKNSANRLAPIEILGFVGMFGTSFVLIVLGVTIVFNPMNAGEFLRTNFVPFFFETYTYGILFLLFQIFGFTIGYLSSDSCETTTKKIADGLCLQIFIVFFAGVLGGIWVWCFSFFNDGPDTVFGTLISFTKAWIIANLAITLVLTLIYSTNQVLSGIYHRWIDLGLLLRSLFP